jgi:hypothetical protein
MNVVLLTELHNSMVTESHTSRGLVTGHDPGLVKFSSVHILEILFLEVLIFDHLSSVVPFLEVSLL